MHSKKQSDFRKNSVVTNSSSPPSSAAETGREAQHAPSSGSQQQQKGQKNTSAAARFLNGKPHTATTATTLQSKTPETTAQMRNDLLLAYHKHLKMALTLSQNLALLQALYFFQQ